MKKNYLHTKWMKDLVVCIGTDIPPIPSNLFMIFGIIEELIIKNNTNILSMDIIFKDFLYDRKGRFQVISWLIKDKFIKLQKVNHNTHLYEIIPKIPYRQSKEMRIYSDLDKKKRCNLRREFKVY
jgi:hypothetical protein